ncbi:hypothetical protein GSI_04090 [Ganoderma sinense ZZ0214-1]|uniref:Cyclin N-terminal domain-containing protein n=1 Tax=Ganoderma sinense ZZ0214-1 TaxID=1077348 RepID=A0A2G8SIC4_9APHY|nr:hypothetical protein GSI_04090 [Ganoderma sinense ZZ0214-1]
MSRRPGSSDKSVPLKQRLMDRHLAREETARVCTNFIKHLFGCPELPPNPPPSILPLKQFIAYIIHRAAHPPLVPIAALFLVERVKTRLPTIDVPCGHRLFLAAYIVVSKLLIDVNYSNYQWSRTAHALFSLEDINQMERDLLACLEWDLQIQPDALVEFEARVRCIFTSLGPYPTYVLPAATHAPTLFSSRPTAEAANSPAGVTPSTTAPERASAGSPMDLDDSGQLILPSPPSDYMLVIPGALLTPELWSPTSATPASSAMPPTPAGHVGSSVAVTGTWKGTSATAVLAAGRRRLTASHGGSSGPSTDAEAGKGNAYATNFSTVGNLLTRVIASVL